MSVDGKEQWLENRAYELFDEMQRKYPHLSYNEIDEMCWEQAEKDYADAPEPDYDWMLEQEEEEDEEETN